MIVKNDLFDYKNRIIYQDNESFKFSLDSILLAEYVETKAKDKNILDMCAGNMAIPLILSKYTDANIIGFEIQKSIFLLGKKSVKENNTNTLKIINDDVKNITNYFPNNYFDIITCNPPYFKVNEEKVINNNESLKIARHEIKLKLEDVFIIAKNILKNNGTLYIVHRSNRLDELIILANKYKINVKKITLISTKKGCNPYLVLVKCIKNSQFGVTINNELCIEGLKTYQNLFKVKK